MAEWRPKKIYEPKPHPLPPKARTPVGIADVRPVAVSPSEIDVNSLLAGTGITISRSGVGGFTFSGTGVLSVTGTPHRITIGGTPQNPTIDIAADYVGQTSITTLGTITTGVWNGSIIGTAYTVAQVIAVTGTLNRITIGGAATNPVVDIAATYVGQTSITTLGTIGTGVWQGTSISTTYTDAKVKSLIAGTGISVSAATGDVTVSATGGSLLYDMGFVWGGKPSDGDYVQYTVAQNITLPAGLTNSGGVAGTAMAASTVLTISTSTDAGSTFSSKGTATFALGSKGPPTFSFASPVSLVPGNIVRITMPTPADATGTDFEITLQATRV